ncbi:DUF6114 domain-containing protein [Streptomyces sp. YU58]|uniref:DUF6114 domain-containing protein n=1 Tax=Streptomyces sp. SX92 TaxID=3158972 RepID=UPI0027B9FBF2|nr:DUF6114 domain-containing protein [Streptomyces coralus]WLW52147.1 DUF6114 domain-containing protein [Streptomyces coralus]
MSAETPAAPGRDEHYLRVFRRNFRAWRGSRPFWSGLFVLLAGFPILYFPYANIQFGHLTLAMATTAGAGSLIIGVLLFVLGLSLWFQKHVRVFAGVAAILLGLVSIPVSNFGGFVIGFMLALVGGAMAVSWAPGEPPAPPVPGTGGQQGGAPESAVPGAGFTKDTQAPQDTRSTDPDTTVLKPLNGLGEPNDLSGTSPVYGANGRHSAG